MSIPRVVITSYRFQLPVTRSSCLLPVPVACYQFLLPVTSAVAPFAFKHRHAHRHPTRRRVSHTEVRTMIAMKTLSALVFLPALMSHAGGWAVITVEDLPDYVVA